MTRALTVPRGMTSLVVPLFPRLGGDLAVHGRHVVDSVAAEQRDAVSGVMPELAAYIARLERENRRLRAIAVGRDVCDAEVV